MYVRKLTIYFEPEIKVYFYFPKEAKQKLERQTKLSTQLGEPLPSASLSLFFPCSIPFESPVT